MRPGPLNWRSTSSDALSEPNDIAETLTVVFEVVEDEVDVVPEVVPPDVVPPEVDVPPDVVPPEVTVVPLDVLVVPDVVPPEAVPPLEAVLLDLPEASQVTAPSKAEKSIAVTVWPSRPTALAGTTRRTHWPVAGREPAL